MYTKATQNYIYHKILSDKNRNGVKKFIFFKHNEQILIKYNYSGSWNISKLNFSFDEFKKMTL